MKKPISVRTKVEAIVLILLMIGITASAITIKWGEDASGDLWSGLQDELITNSNGKAWIPTNANLLTAIYDLNNTGGIVYLPNATITITTTINISHSNVSLIGVGRNSVLYTADDINILELWGTANFPNDLRGVNVEGVTFKGSAGHTSKAGITLGRGHHNRIHKCFFTNLYDGMNIGDTDDTDNGWFNANHFQAIRHYAMYFSARCQENIISDNTMEPGTNCDVGIFMNGQNNVIISNTIEEVGIGSGLGDGIYLSGMENVVNGNTVRSCGRMGIYCTYGTGVGNQTITSNYIEDCNNQGIYVKGQNHLINNNMLNNNGINALVVDVGSSPSGGTGILISNNHIGGYAGSAIVDNTGNCTLLGNVYNSAFQLLVTPSTASIDVDGELWFKDSGNQMFEFSYSSGYSYLRGSQNAADNMRIQPIAGLPYIDLLGASDIRFYKDDDTSDYFRFYHGATKQILAITLDAGETDCELSSPGGYNITIDAVLKLEPMASAPTSPVEGMTYVNSGDHHIYCYLNAGWVQLDN